MKKLLSMAIIASMTMVSCSKENPVEIKNQLEKEIKLTAGITASADTKASYSPSSAVAGVQFLRIDNASDASAPSFATGTTLLTGDIAATSGVITFTSPVPNYDKAADNYAWFVGYFPALTAGQTWTIDGTKDIMTTDAPLNAGKYTSPNASSTMAFEHRLAQLFIKCEAAAGVTEEAAKIVWGNITKIEVVDVQNIATYTNGTAAVAFSGTEDIALVSTDLTAPFAGAAIGSGNDVAGAMLAPLTGGSITISLRITTENAGAKSVAVSMPSFAASTKNTITLSFGAADLPIGTKASIGEWTEGGSGSGIVPLT